MDPGTPVATASAGYPLQLALEAPNKIARWRPFLHWIMAIPHFFIWYVLQLLANVITFLAFFAILFTKRYPEGMFKLVVMAMRYGWRVMSFYMYLREDYPRFEFPSELEDPRTDPARLSVEYPAELSRWLPFVKWLLAFPHYVALIFVFIGALVVWFLSFFAVLFTGKYPEGMRNYMVGAMRWGQRVGMYTSLMTDRYPPFSMQ